MKKVTKAIIPVAGLGTRFLPWSKNIPKEMLPILNKPTIQYIVEEAVAAGITDIIFITSDSKEALIDHFDRHLFLEDVLAKKGKYALIEELRAISKLARFYTVRQDEPKGLGHAVLQAKSFIGNEPFALLLGDDVTYNPEYPVLKQMIDKHYETKGGSVLGVSNVRKEDVSKYGIVSPEKHFDKHTVLVKTLVEKPSINKAPSTLAIAGRYLLDSKIFDFLQDQNVDVNTNEIQITDSIQRLAGVKPVYAYEFQAKRYDMGSKVGFIEANIDYALRDPELKDRIIDLLKHELVSKKVATPKKAILKKNKTKLKIKK